MTEILLFKMVQAQTLVSVVDQEIIDHAVPSFNSLLKDHASITQLFHPVQDALRKGVVKETYP